MYGRGWAGDRNTVATSASFLFKESESVEEDTGLFPSLPEGRLWVLLCSGNDTRILM